MPVSESFESLIFSSSGTFCDPHYSLPPFPSLLVCRLSNMASTRTLLFAYSALWLSVDKHFLKILSLFGSVLRIESTQQKGIYLKFNTCSMRFICISPITGPRCPDGSSKLRFPDYVTMPQDGGKVVNLTHLPLFIPRKYSWYSEVCHPRCVFENWKGYVVKHSCAKF